MPTRNFTLMPDHDFRQHQVLRLGSEPVSRLHAHSPRFKRHPRGADLDVAGTRLATAIYAAPTGLDARRIPVTQGASRDARTTATALHGEWDHVV